jgi:subtilisin family serine protease
MRMTIAMAALLTALSAQAGQLSPGLERQLAGLDPAEEIKVLVCLPEAPIARLDRQLHESRAPRAMRHQQVIEALQAAAARHQPPLLDRLAELKAEGKVLGWTPRWLINAVVVRTTVATAPFLAELPGVEIVEADLVPALIEPVAVGPHEPASGARVAEPGVVAVRATEVWNSLGIDGSGALVGSLDTGVLGSHTALSSRWRGNHGHATSACWLDAAGLGHAIPQDSHGHGTHTVGTMVGGAPGDEVGVAPGALWIASNVINMGAGPAFDNAVIASLEWMADPDGNPGTLDDVPDVVQNSWGVHEGFSGYVDCDSRWWTAIDNCEAAGVVTTWSAGNEGPGGTSLRSPADRASSPWNCFSVGATEATAPYSIASFSSRGPSGCDGVSIKPEISAPGVNTRSCSNTGGYTTMSGTSMAGPHLAGVVALMRSANPDLDVQTIKQILMDTAVDLGAAGEDNIYGHGFVDAYEAVLQAMVGYGTLGGTVTDADGGAPLAGVLVRSTAGAPQTLTDGSGNYEMFFPAGGHDIEFSYYGYATLTLPATIEAGEGTVLDAQLTALPSATVSGVVRDPEGQPVAGAQVRVTGAPIAPVTTGPGGGYAFSLPIGEEWTLVAQASADPLTLPQAADDYGYRAFDPGDAVWSEASFTLPAGGLVLDLQGRNRVVYAWSLIDPDQGGPGTALPFDADDQTLSVELPFIFPYYGQECFDLWICGNGWMAFESTASTEWRGQAIPTAAEPNGVLAPFWEDLSPQQAGSGNISTWHDAAGGRFVIEFHQIRQYSPATDFESFQVILLDPAVHPTLTGDGAILFMYESIGETDNATVGIENPAGDDGLQYYYGRSDGFGNPGGALPETNPAPASGLALLFTTGLLGDGGGGELDPVTVQIAHQAGSINLSWTASPGASLYRVETRESLDAAWVVLGTTATTGWSLPAAQPVQLFRVVATN